MVACSRQVGGKEISRGSLSLIRGAPSQGGEGVRCVPKEGPAEWPGGRGRASPTLPVSQPGAAEGRWWLMAKAWV